MERNKVQNNSREIIRVEIECQSKVNQLSMPRPILDRDFIVGRIDLQQEVSANLLHQQKLPNKKRRRLQFSLRLLLLFVVIVSAACTLVAMPQIMVRSFMHDVNGGNLDRAYRNTSSSFQGYVSRDEFGSYVASHLTKESIENLDNGHLEFDQRDGLSIWIGISRKNRFPGRLVFVWERFGWKFKPFGGGRGLIIFL